jgi:glucokinase
MKKYAVCIDVDDVQINAVLFDMYNNYPINESRIICAFDHRDSANRIIDCWSIAIKKILQQLGSKELSGIGISIPGSFDYQEGTTRFGIIDNQFQNLKGLSIDVLLRNKLHLTEEIPIRIINYTNALAIGESWLGKASIYPRSIAFTFEDKFELSFLKRGVPVNNYDKITNLKGANAKKYFITPELLTLCRSSEKGGRPFIIQPESDIQQIFNDFGDHLGVFLSPWIKIFNAKSLIIGGKITEAWGLFGTGLIQSLQNQDLHPKIILPNYNDTSIMAGCARIVSNSFWYKMVPVLERV